jgi:hypothetical protein
MPHPSTYRKMLKAALLLVVGVLLASCGGRSAPQAEATKEPVVVIVTAAPTEEPTAEATEEPTAKPTKVPTEEPTAEPAAEPTAETTDSTSSGDTQTDIQGEFEDVRLNYDVVKNGKKGLEIVSDFSVENAKSKRCHIAAYFSLSDGRPLKAAKDAVYSTDDGNVSVGDDFIPKYDSSKFTDYTLFIPYDAFNFEEGSGEADIKVVLRLYDDKTKSFFAKSPEKEFTYTQGQPSNTKEVTGKVTDLKVEFNVTEGGKKGMRIATNFTVNDAKGVKCNIAAYFSYADGKKLVAGDDEEFKTPDGQVAVFDTFTPKYDSSDFSDYPLFIPYSALNFKPGAGKADLKLVVKLYTTVEKPFFAESEAYEFEYTQK